MPTCLETLPAGRRICSWTRQELTASSPGLSSWTWGRPPPPPSTSPPLCDTGHLLDWTFSSPLPSHYDLGYNNPIIMINISFIPEYLLPSPAPPTLTNLSSSSWSEWATQSFLSRKNNFFFFLDFEKRKEICVLELVCLPDTIRWECDLRLEVVPGEGLNFFISLFFNCILFSGYSQYINPFHNSLHTSPSFRLGPRDKDPTQIDFLLSTSLPLSYFFMFSISTHFNTFDNQYTVNIQSSQ